jgi:hypothetical protein
MKQSHVEKMRRDAQENRQAIQKLLSWDDLKYCEFQERQGRAYLQTVICPDGYGVQELLRSRIFWRWWINQWNRRDDDFINSDVYSFERALNGDLYTYTYINTPSFLQGLYPHRVIFYASYSVMIGELLDNK